MQECSLKTQHQLRDAETDLSDENGQPIFLINFLKEKSAAKRGAASS
jgi:hypothetical protein